jgi:hypothetical protein
MRGSVAIPPSRAGCAFAPPLLLPKHNLRGNDMFKVRFMALTGKFTTVRTESYATHVEAIEAVRVYATTAGYQSVREVDDYDGKGKRHVQGPFYGSLGMDEVRVTATTPGGRAGRSVAFIEALALE